MATVTRKRSVSDWTKLAERRLAATLKAAQREPQLKKRIRTERAWTAHVLLVGSIAMARLNRKFRGKKYATDILSFPSPEHFQAEGLIGDLLICLPTLKRQAREQKHTPEKELNILIVHGALHLLGLDHEQGKGAAEEMERWEAKLLGVKAKAKAKGLIARSG